MKKKRIENQSPKNSHAYLPLTLFSESFGVVLFFWGGVVGGEG
jgi:hypothetical protein